MDLLVHPFAERSSGFPAHAGMDPRVSRSATDWPRFPRPRGDGPREVITHIHEVPVSPPTRGWTRTSQFQHIIALGFPAHAGMDLISTTAPRAAFGFPRPRGDGPLALEDSDRLNGVSPPTRGWTSHGHPHRLPCRGFPAHAGMDPGLTMSSSSVAGFPRPRGDGPLPRDLDEARAEVSPPTRGWTWRADHGRPADQGFPAHAGMDPIEIGTDLTEPWFPRPRGDGPCSGRLKLTARRVSPPTRGWTLMDSHRYP